MLRVGVDENGLGAQLGPLVVTGVLARVSPAGAAELKALPAQLRPWLDDSKQLVRHGKVALGEAWARSLASEARSPAEVLERLSLEGVGALRTRCPPAARGMCWQTDGELFEAPDELLRQVAEARRELAALGIELLTARSSLVCTGQLNEARHAGASRFDCDLHAMERVVLALQQHAGVELEAVCGKVGGITAYGDYFGPLAGRLHTTLAQAQARSSYHFPGLGTLHFVRDADSLDPLVALASLIGKWLRELTMARIVRQLEPGGRASGYSDPVTQRFIARTEARRRQLGVPESCFRRSRS